MKIKLIGILCLFALIACNNKHSEQSNHALKDDVMANDTPAYHKNTKEIPAAHKNGIKKGKEKIYDKRKLAHLLAGTWLNSKYVKDVRKNRSTYTAEVNGKNFGLDMTVKGKIVIT